MDVIETARATLRAGRAVDALEQLRGAEGAAADWLRAVGAAALGDAVRTAVALRALTRTPNATLPDHPELDVALPLADVALSGADVHAPYVAIASVLAAARGQKPPSDPLVLAWETLIRAADLTPPDSADHCRQVLALGAVGHRLGRPEAGSLLRAAQERALRLRSVELLERTSEALARFHADDPELVHEIGRWTRRQVEALRSSGA